MFLNRLLLVCFLTFMLTLTGCGSDDGQISNELELPTDALLTLYCADAGIYPERCILEDPSNPYRHVAINEQNKWELSSAAPSAKSRFYVWATALAHVPTGENQYYVATSLHELYTEGTSLNAKEQAKRAYRSVLDSFYDSITYWEAVWIDPVDPPLYAIPLKDLSGQRIHNPTGDGLSPLFDNEWFALDELARWGYSFDPTVGDDSLSGTGTLF